MRIALLATAVVMVAACGGPIDVEVGDLPATDATHFATVLASLDKPAVVNVWASWCVPCRSEAPLLRQAHARFGDQVEFIGVDVQDDQRSAQDFIAEFGLGFQHFFDPDRSVPASLGGIGVPITYFVAADGSIVATHNGVIDEGALALGIDELLRR